ncbi:hypothetical protein C8J56DRAFT_316262 [Mycena floridula]|nr:hypothetical protein C8J56DRAFT_316262 [Mycena floridula]
MSITSPSTGSLTSRSRSSTKLGLNDDAPSLTSFNPFSEEDENDQSSYTLVTSIFSRMKNTLSAPLASASTISSTPSSNGISGPSDLRRPSYTVQTQSSLSSRGSNLIDRPNSLNSGSHSNPAPPLVSYTPAQSELPTYHLEYDRSPSRNSGMVYTPVYESSDGGMFGTAIPGFPIQDDTRSIKTSTGSLHRSGSVSKVIRRIRGEGLSKDYWMDDENCKECYDCKSVFTTWRRKHHCRICGQIFCSRCASNIIKGARFGQDGMLRVCNLCVEKLAKVEDDDDDDRRSVVSSVGFFPAHQLGLDILPQSPFAASQLFSRTDEPFNLYSIAETKRRSGSVDSDFPSRPISLHESWDSPRGIPAPFRRGLSDEDKDPDSLSNPFSETNTPDDPSGQIPIDFPGFPALNASTTNFIQFPMGSPDLSQDIARPPSRLRSQFNSYADFEAATPFIRSRVQSILDNTGNAAEPGWRTRRESTAYAQELNITSMNHLRLMLRQMLDSEQVPNADQWQGTLLKIALRIARDLTFTTLPHRQGEDMDVRRYVKIKKIPGGTPQDSEYVDGAVITKNVAHKQMARFHRNPRVMLVTFPLEFSRVEGQYLHFGQIVRQEKEYLGNLASRIAALRPHIVLVQQSVSRLALDALASHNIAVARGVKPSAIQLVTRMTQADVFSSMDKLALEPRLGHCSRFRIQTFDHPLIPGRRKTYMRFEGCSRDMGCTIILRGADIATLRRIKKVTRFLIFIVRNLKLETHLWKDSVITLPALSTDSFLAPGSRHSLNLSSGSLSPFPSSLLTPRLNTPTPPPLATSRSQATVTNNNYEDDLPDEDAEQFKLSRRIDESLEPYNKTLISVSATLRFPAPYPIRRMKELDLELMTAKREWEDEIVRREEGARQSQEQEMTPMPIVVTDFDSDSSQQDDINAQIEALPSPGQLAPSEDSTPLRNDEGGSYFSPIIPTASSALQFGLMATPISENPPELLKTAADTALESQYNRQKWKHEEQRRIWEWHLRKNNDDFVVEKYQCISLVEYIVPTADFGSHRACFAPRLNYITFYGENDCTLGQFIEKSIGDTLAQFLDPKALCTGKGCEQPLARHSQVFVHNESKLFVAVEQWDGQIIGRSNYPPTPDLLTTWSVCRVCGSATPFIPVSEEMQRYSFAKFLELHFYPADVKLVQGAGCQHNIYQHHIRYFASKGMTVRFQTEPIVLHEVVYPPSRIHVRPETQLELKNSDFRRLHDRNMMWYTGLIDDLKLISIEAATGDEESDARLLVNINSLIVRADAERSEVFALLNRVYRESSPADTLALNQVRSFRQDKIVAWQQDFDRLPKPRNIERSSKRTSAFGSVRAMWPRRYELSGAFDHPHLPSSSVSEAEEGPLNMRRVTGDSFTSSASEASEAEAETNVEPAEPSTVPLPEEDNKERAPRELSEDPKSPKSDPESDSTIGAGRDDEGSPDIPRTASDDKLVADSGKRQTRQSRLPRRAVHHPSVAELVRKYQDFIPPQGIHALAKTAFAATSVVSESEQEYVTPIRTRARSKSRHRLPARKASTSDFEQGYAANIAPRYLTQSRKSLAHAPGSRIPGPIGSAFESRDSSRRPSPEKRSMSGKGKEVRFGRPSSPPNAKAQAAPKAGRTRTRARERTPSRSSSTAGTKSTFRRPSNAASSKVSNIAKHFERLGRDAERAKGRYTVIRGRRARPVASARAKVEILDSVKDAIKDESESSDSSSEADDEGDGNDGRVVPQIESPESDHIIEPSAKTAPPVERFPESSETLTAGEQPAGNDNLSVPATRTTSLPPSPFLSSVKTDISATPPHSDLDMGGGTERNSILKALSGFWLQPPPVSRNSSETEDPMHDPEHIFRDSSMVVRTDEPTSIIALALNSPQYRDMLAKSRADKRTAREAKLTEGGEQFMPDDTSAAETTSTWGVVNVDASSDFDPTEDLKVPSSKLPWAISFESGGLTISCTLLYPEQFDALRRTYDCEKIMIESLARCVRWNANGGKSGSAFLKTRDDRFIAKELSRPELQTMETFAPAYFDYMSSAVSANRPTLLAKVFGCFKLTFRKTGNDKTSERHRSTQMNLLVMENLFYDRRFSKIYDLKGSTRNRHVQSTGRENEVLLDENLVETAHLSPFYVREHSKRIMRGALFNDSKFLADIHVMDYSLIVGVDSQNNELVVGIVDYVRTYTWDKKLESWVKESAFLGGRGEPTIVTPKQYRQRFISAMERYFPLIPDRWTKQKDAPEDSHGLVELWPDW